MFEKLRFAWCESIKLIFVPHEIDVDIELQTEHPVAIASADHQFPRGAAVDITRAAPIVRFCIELFGKPPTYLDLDCSGGGVVVAFVLRGSLAIGLEVRTVAKAFAGT